MVVADWYNISAWCNGSIAVSKTEGTGSNPVVGVSNNGAWPSGKAPEFDFGKHRFKSYRLSYN